MQRVVTTAQIVRAIFDDALIERDAVGIDCLPGRDRSPHRIELCPLAVDVIGTHVAAAANSQSVPGGDLIHVRRLQRMLESIGGTRNKSVRQKRRAGFRSTDRVEPIENTLDHLVGRNELADRRPWRVDDRSFVVPVVRRVTAGGRGLICGSLIDFRNVAAVADAESIATVALRIEICGQARAHRAVIDGLVACLIAAVGLVVSAADVEAPMRIQVPFVVDEKRAHREI